VVENDARRLGRRSHRHRIESDIYSDTAQKHLERGSRYATTHDHFAATQVVAE
jgi:hypothetical protein